jgi:hypothetical protein
MSTTSTRRGGDYELPPAGTHISRCYAIIDLGTQEVLWQNKAKLQPKVHIRWELCHELMEDGKPFSVGEKYTNSTDPKANLRHHLESWAGRSMTPSEVEGFDLSKLLGKACQLTVSHEPGKRDPSKTYAVVKAVTPLAKGMTAPPMVNKPLHYQVEQGANEVYHSLSEYLRKTIAVCQEWQKDDKPEPGAPAAEEQEDSGNIPF